MLPHARIKAILFTSAAVLNVPFGDLRRHTEKFSFAWFLAVHAAVPLVIALRKTPYFAIVPKRAALPWSLSGAVVGQLLGARAAELYEDKSVPIQDLGTRAEWA